MFDLIRFVNKCQCNQKSEKYRQAGDKLGTDCYNQIVTRDIGMHRKIGNQTDIIYWEISFENREVRSKTELEALLRKWFELLHLIII